MAAGRRVVSGMRPTGPLHLGHYVGVLRTWAALQGDHDCFFFTADWHALVDRREESGRVAGWIREMVADWIACGVDPERCTMFVQSAVPEHLEFFWILGSLAPVGMLERSPTYKEEAARLGGGEAPSYALLGYPLLQAADVALYRGERVPVGEDQVAHLELAREIVRRLKRTYGVALPEPEPLLTDAPRLVGTDGRAKMSKKLDNCIYLSDDAATVERRVRGMYTDPRRVRADVPGRVEGNPVFVYHDLFNSDRGEVEDLKARYREGRVGDVEVKERLARALNAFLEPVRRRRAEILADAEGLERILRRGIERARREARETLGAVRRALGGNSIAFGGGLR
jgi:tryptophanyl-tRNA synthetase